MGRLGGLAALAASVLVLAACGGEEGTPSEGADLVPATASLVAVVNTDFESDQWQAANALIERFPGGRDGIRGLFRMQEEIDFEGDVEPALGPEVIVAALGPQPDSAVVLTQPDDPAKFRELAAMEDESASTLELSDGWWAAAPSEEALASFDEAREEGDSLADSDAWGDATEGLPEETLALVYASTGSVDQFESDDLPPEAFDALKCVTGGEGTQPAGFAVSAEEDGFHFEGSSEFPEGFPEPDAAASELADVLPSGALGLASIRSLGEYIREAVRCAAQESDEIATQLAQVELALGLSLEEDILPLLAQEAAVAVYPQDGEDPAVVVATQVEDEEEALEVVDRIVERARLLETGLSLEETDLEGVAVRRVLVDGVPFLVYGAVNGILGFSNVDGGLLSLRGDAAPLSEDQEYQAAREAAGAPDEDVGFVYVDAKEIVGLVTASLSEELPFDVSGNLEPLRSLFLWATLEDGRASVEGLLRIE